jgi:hypothetical protein
VIVNILEVIGGHSHVPTLWTPQVIEPNNSTGNSVYPTHTRNPYSHLVPAIYTEGIPHSAWTSETW